MNDKKGCGCYPNTDIICSKHEDINSALRVEDFMDLDLKHISEYAEEVQGQWNGKESGRGEERADIAKNIVEKVAELRKLLAELDNF